MRFSEYIYKFELMTSPCSLHIFHKNKDKSDKIAKKILTSSKILESRYNFYNPDSYLSKINRREINILDRRTKELLQKAKIFYNRTDKIFDITVGTLSILKREKSIDNLAKRKEKLLPFVGVEHFKIKRDKIIFDNPYTLIDLGGFVKEYAIDMAVKILKKDKIASALINFGGDIYALGVKPDGKPFTIGIKNPLNPKENILSIEIKNQALTTSASYERGYKIENRSYSHIVSKGSFQNRILSTTVIAPSTLEAGVYSTSLMVNPNLKISLKKILIDNELNIKI